LINDLERKLAEGDTKTGGTEVKQGRGVTDAVHRSSTPSPVVKLDDNSRVGDVSCKCNLNSSTLCVNGSVIGESTSEPVGHHSKSNYLGYSYLPLPQLIYSSERKPIFRRHPLNKFRRPRCVPKPLPFAIALESSVGVVGKRWVATAARNLRDYYKFNEVFIQAHWPKGKQSLVRCSLYQNKFSPGGVRPTSSLYYVQNKLARAAEFEHD
jgi:hypothetical protein